MMNPVPHPRRGGVTLTEVLMATMLMGIGVVTLASLFPISVLNSIKATQLTNATALRYNAEAMVETLGPSLQTQIPIPATSNDPPRPCIIDPLGAANATAPVDANFFGHLSGGGPGTIPRINFLGNHAVLPDSWTPMVEGIATSNNLTSLTFEPQISLIDITIPSTVNWQILMISQDGRAAVTRKLNNVNDTTHTVSWAEDLPSGFTPFRAKILAQEDRYSYLITARTSLLTSGTVSCDMSVVVFFRRGFRPSDERIYEGVGGQNAFKAHNNQVTIEFDPTADEPFLKKGAFVLDAVNGFWYRIKDYNVWNGQATITLDRNAVMSSTGAILMTGIVEVYPIGNKEL